MRRANSRALTRIRPGAVDQAFVPGPFSGERVCLSARPRKDPERTPSPTVRPGSFSPDGVVPTRCYNATHAPADRQQAAASRHHDLHGHVAPRRGTRCHQSLPGVPRLRAARAPARSRQPPHAQRRRRQPVRTAGRPAQPATSDRRQGLRVLRPHGRSRRARSRSLRVAPRRSSVPSRPSSAPATKSSCSTRPTIRTSLLL